MRQKSKYRTVFVDNVPNRLEKDTLYVCIKYNIAAHLCMCGCGEEIFTPISKIYGWTLSYDGTNVSLSPSIGNGAYACKSHYFLKNGRVKWVEKDMMPKRKKNMLQESICFIKTKLRVK